MNDSNRRLADHITSVVRGPVGGEDELLERNPIYAYLVGALFPVETGETECATEAELEGFDDAVGDDGTDDEDPVEDADDDEGDYDLTGAFGFAPTSMGASFVHNGKRVRVSLRAGLYEPHGGADSGEDQADPRPRYSWSRRTLAEVLDIETPSGRRSVLDGRAIVAWRVRSVGVRSLVTVSVSNAAEVGPKEAKLDASKCLFQVELEAEPVDGSLEPYPTLQIAAGDHEDRELDLRYRDRVSYGVGHGVSVTWDEQFDGPPASIRSDTAPSFEVPSIQAREDETDRLRMDWLADDRRHVSELAAALDGLVDEYSQWARDQREDARSFAGSRANSAQEIVARQERARDRMRQGIEILREDPIVLQAFRLANRAMRDQMVQQHRAREAPGELGAPLSVAPAPFEPRWRPFQLGFILLALPSTLDASHDDRALVDLVWFPTGGGKTEAYLGLAATELIRRRLVRGIAGGGTAVITRYTMRLLTAQQFERASTLICALERLRTTEPALAGCAPFTIGLWIGNNATPGRFARAERALDDLLEQRYPENPFQVLNCPWCRTALVPKFQSPDRGRYGFRATDRSFTIFCPHPECPFHDRLPMQVVDEAIYRDPPSILIATVDKFARLAWIDDGAELFGLGASIYDPPSLVIQDELHLISGPLGTVVGTYEAALRTIWGWRGTVPKVVASTATVRAATQQVRELMAADVEVFPPAGLKADESWFAAPDRESPGRLYLGLMPQAHTPEYAFSQIAERILQAPLRLALSDVERDAYWTLVVYHNSLRELGRSVTRLRDDVATRMQNAPATGDGSPSRRIDAADVEELNGNLDARELADLLRRLQVERGDPRESALDAVAATNILSVGVDVGRLGLMVVNGQPKTTSEYIQATSRVGRAKVPGLVVALYRSSKARDRSIYETFRQFHESYYRFVEPASVTPWSLQARMRALRAALVIVMRQAGGLRTNESAAAFDAKSIQTATAVQRLLAHATFADPTEQNAVRRELERAALDWQEMRDRAARSGSALRFDSTEMDRRLLRGFTDAGPGWPAMNSMRSVDRAVGIKVGRQR
ncbi:helicase [Agrococcus sediminis]|uniref:Helicase n=1 Tax=Agrococcus sediminis TaxID=2599924 RepID=A0A5M8QM90_9MICO|nr:helicase-related protein [Agrococcus sediminis]KAA6436291.1 helicase [Agrococcus sediminis]